MVSFPYWAPSRAQLMTILGTYTAPTSTQVKAGAVTSTTLKVNYDISASIVSEILTCGLVVSTHADMSSPAFTATPVAPTQSSGVAVTYYSGSFTATGLTADTAYYYAPVVNGTVITASRGTVRTAPTNGTAKTFSFSVISCSDANQVASSAFLAMAASPVAFCIHCGDIDYSEIAVNSLPVTRDRNIRRFMQISGVPAFALSTPLVYMYDDHDAAPNDNQYDSFYPSGATNTEIITNSRAVIREIFPYYPTLQDAVAWPTIGTNIIAQQWNWGRCRFLMPDLRAQRRYVTGTPTIFGNGTNPPSSWDQATAIIAAINQAASDGVKILFFISSSTWQPAVFDSWLRFFNADQIAICDTIRDADVQVVLIHGDSHQCGCDDGTYSDFSTKGDTKFFTWISSPVQQTLVLHGITALSWNGVDGDISGPIAPTGSGNSAAFATVTVTDNGGTDITVGCTWTGNPYTGAVGTTLRTVSSADATRTVQFAGGSALHIPTSADATVTLSKSWPGPCSVHWAGDDGTSGTVTFLPNRSTGTFSHPYVAGATVIFTLSSPSGCVLGATTTQTLSYYTPAAETTTYLAAWSVQPTSYQAMLINDYIAGLKTDSLWSTFTKLWFLGTPSQQASLLNMVTPADTPNVSHNATFAGSRGWAGNAIDAYIETAYPMPAGKQNSNTVGTWTLDDSRTNGDFGNSNYYMNPWAVTLGDIRTRNSAGTTSSIVPATTSVGLLTASRVASAGYSVYRNGALSAAVTQTSAAPSASETLWICSANIAAGILYGNRRLALAFVASGWDATQNANFYTRTHTLLQGLGIVA